MDWANAAQPSAVAVHADYNDDLPRHVPQFLARALFNAWGYDSGTNSVMFDYDGYFYGDVDDDTVLGRLPPNSTAPNYINMTAPLNRTLLGL